MKEIEIKVTKYVAEDGTQFDDKESCEKHDAECRVVSDACSNRIAMIQAKRKALDDEAERIKREKEVKLEGLHEQILSIKHRIKELISVGCELQKNGFQTKRLWMWVGCGSVGFMKNRNGDIAFAARGMDKFEKELDRLYGGVHFGWCTFYVFTDGETIKYKYSSHDNRDAINEVLVDTKIELCEKFIKEFSDFEAELYEEIDDMMK